jgi:hypothetical protein
VLEWRCRVSFGVSRDGKMPNSRVYIAKPAEGTAGEYSIDGYETSSVQPIVSASPPQPRSC